MLFAAAFVGIASEICAARGVSAKFRLQVEAWVIPKLGCPNEPTHKQMRPARRIAMRFERTLCLLQL
jgi:hypothetical protein